MSIPKKELHELVDSLLEGELKSAKLFLQFLIEQRKEQQEFEGIADRILQDNIEAFKRLAE